VFSAVDLSDYIFTILDLQYFLTAENSIEIFNFFKFSNSIDPVHKQ